jgi:phage terminase large subunit-like protein
VLINNLNVGASASRFMPLSVDASSMDGLNVHGAIIDELHAHKTRPRR